MKFFLLIQVIFKIGWTIKSNSWKGQPVSEYLSPRLQSVEDWSVEILISHYWHQTETGIIHLYSTLYKSCIVKSGLHVENPYPCKWSFYVHRKFWNTSVLSNPGWTHGKFQCLANCVEICSYLNWGHNGSKQSPAISLQAPFTGKHGTPYWSASTTHFLCIIY